MPTTIGSRENAMSERLALLGGEPITRKDFPPYNTIDEREKREVMEVLDSGVLSAFLAAPGPAFRGGPKVRKLEQAWAEHFGIKHVVSMNSATSALCAAVAACGIGPGDEVITTPLTMTATPTAVLANGAVPVFADIDPQTLNLDPAAVARRVTERTKAIYVVHLAGHPADIDPIMELADRHNLFVLEDNAQAPGAKYRGRHTGCIGHIGVFSLNCHKTIQAGEGGIAVTDDDRLATKLCLVRNHGETRLESFGLSEDENLIGFNFRMTEMEAAVAYHQLGKLEELNAWRIRLADYLTRRIEEEFDCLSPPYVAPDRTHVYYIYHMRYDEAKAGIPLDLFAEAVRAEGVPLSARWIKPLYRMSIYRQRSAFGNSGWPFQAPWCHNDVSYAEGICPHAEAAEHSSVYLETLVRRPNAEEDMELTVRAMHKVFDGRAALLEFRETHAECAKP